MSKRRCLITGLLIVCVMFYLSNDVQPTPAQNKTVTIAGNRIDARTDIIALMLKSRDLTRETARIDPKMLERLAASEALVQPHFLRYWKNPYEFPKFVYQLLDAQERSCAGKEEGIFEVFALSHAQNTGKAVLKYKSVLDLKPSKDKPIHNALDELAAKCQTKLTQQEKLDLDAVLKDVPVELQVQLARLILGAAKAKYHRDCALLNLPKEKWNQAFASPTGKINSELGQALDYDEFYTGAAINLKAICELNKFLSGAARLKKPLPEIAFEINTPMGKIAFNNKEEDNVYQGEDYLIIIDMAGDDTYNGAAAASYKIDHPISIVIDWAGNDSYIADKDAPCAQGAGIMGYGFLIDNGGDDTFIAVNNAQGMCYFGVGILWANGGNDKFQGHTSVQGSAFFGVANLVKTGGNDSYYACFTSQGFGFTAGYGALIDTSGDDKYVAEPYILFNPAKGGHDNMRNYNFCQGAGWGQRGDKPGGYSMAGGTGILQDLAGNDRYECGVYGQATGYWYGTGILHDKSGNDHYEGSFFVQSGTAHMGLTMLLDEAGNDSYHTWRSISQAGAHDFSVSFLIDKNGDDKFSAWEWKDEDGKQTLTNTGVKGVGGGILAGSAITNSIAIFINSGGNDTYEYYTKDSFGWSNQRTESKSWRYQGANIAIFIDVGGNDTYNTAIEKDTPAGFEMPENNSSWSRISDKGNKNITFSMGIDAAQGKVPEMER